MAAANTDNVFRGTWYGDNDVLSRPGVQGRLLSEQPASSTSADLLAWRAAAITALVALVLVWTAAIVMYIILRKRHAVGRLEAESCECEAFVGKRAERGECSASSSVEPRASPNGSGGHGDEELLKRDAARGLAPEGVHERLAQLEREAAPAHDGTHERLAPREPQEQQANGSSKPEPPFHPPTQLRSIAREVAEEAFPRSPPAAFCSPTPPAGEPPTPKIVRKRLAVRDAAVGTDPEFLPDFGQTPTRRRLRGHSVNASFGPTTRQLRLPEPPEKASYGLEERSSLKLSIGTIQRQLQRRDAQAQELRRQIAECQQSLRSQTLGAQVAASRLQVVLNDTSTVPRVQAEELDALQNEKVQMAERLEVAKRSEQNWAMLAKRQRAYFMQTERLGQEGALPIKMHPAGELFLAPPPVSLEGDDDDMKRPPWDVGTSHMNPYVVDSWPFEPNVQAQRLAVEPNLNRWEEVDEELFADDTDDDEDDEIVHHVLSRRGEPSPRTVGGPALSRGISEGDDDIDEALGIDEDLDDDAEHPQSSVATSAWDQSSPETGREVDPILSPGAGGSPPT